MKHFVRVAFLIAVVFGSNTVSGQDGAFSIAVVQYRGGGDWYSNPKSVPNLIRFCNEKLDMDMNDESPYVEVGSLELFNYPLVHLTGHGNVVFSSSDAENLRNYLVAGGFLHISDNFGLDPFIRTQMKKVFPELDFVELPFEHPIYHQEYEFNKGLPKIHVHNNLAPQGFVLHYEGRLVCFYDYECDLGDGWEDWEVHKDSDETRRKALEMGANIVEFVMMGKE